MRAGGFTCLIFPESVHERRRNGKLAQNIKFLDGKLKFVITTFTLRCDCLDRDNFEAIITSLYSDIQEAFRDPKCYIYLCY